MRVGGGGGDEGGPRRGGWDSGESAEPPAIWGRSAVRTSFTLRNGSQECGIRGEYLMLCCTKPVKIVLL